MDTQARECSSVLLEASGLTKAFRGLRAMEDYGLRLRGGEILGIIGPNGAGKSTVFNALTGHIHADSGKISFLGKDITKAAPYRIARAGIGRTFQNIRLFQSMSVLDNVVSARQLGRSAGFLDTVLSTPRLRRKEAALKEESLELLSIFGLSEKADLPSANLAYGEQRKLEIVRALALSPRVILLDEPVAGMNQGEKDEMLELIRRVRDEYSLAVVIIEHNMPVVMRLCERIQVLSYGHLIAEGSPDEIRNDARVIESYLGKEDELA
jgi:branched-chain amino acid transport system ATP-binding protein